MILAPPAAGVGRPFLPAAPAGVGPLCIDVALSETGAERSLTLMIRCSSLTSVKNRAFTISAIQGFSDLRQWGVDLPPHPMVQQRMNRLDRQLGGSWLLRPPVHQYQT